MKRLLFVLIFSICLLGHTTEDEENYSYSYHSGLMEIATQFYPITVRGFNNPLSIGLRSGYYGREQYENPQIVMVEIVTPTTHEDNVDEEYGKPTELSCRLICRKNNKMVLSVRLFPSGSYVYYGWAPFDSFRAFFSGSRPARTISCRIGREYSFSLPANVIQSFRTFIDHITIYD